MSAQRNDDSLLAIVADDLTGAADTAAQFATPERRALVSLGPRPSCLPKDAAGASAWAIDADCRHSAPDQCVERINDASAQLARLRRPLYSYVKLDSTLRGNVGASLAAAHQGQGVVLAPAFPERQRTVVGGVLLVDGKPVAETEVANDSAAPVSQSEVAGIVHRQWKCRSAVFNPRRIGSPEALAAELNCAICGGVELMVMDSESPQDLEIIAAALDDPGLRCERPGILPAGSAGLARGIAALRGVRRALPLPPAVSSEPMAVLAVVGSRTSAAAAQVAALQDAGVECLAADAPNVVAGAAARLGEQQPVAIIPGGAGHETVAGAAADALARRGGGIGLVLSGGATARRLCELASIRHFWITGELQSGVAAGVWVRVDDAELPLVIKGGAAGNAEALVEAIRWMRGG